MPVFNGNNFNNIIIASPIADTLNGFGGNDVLIALGGNDLLNGGTGADVMIGGTGNDTYIVDNFGDVVAESFNEGIDTILSSINLSLNVNGRLDVENLTLIGGAITGVGNGLGNTIVGNAFNNNLFGLGGNDRLFGQGGNDNMFGGTGNDLLNGGIGADIMRGEAGNDTYVVDNFGDNVIELVGGGIDTILSSVSLSLNVGGRVNVENLTLTGAAPLNGAGNALGNTIVGNNAANFLFGLGGNDRLFGLGGNDRLDGSTGNDRLTGGLGIDTIITGTGFDRVVFNVPLGAANADRVLDFNPVFDTFELENAFFTGLPGGVLAAAAFRVGAVAADATDRIVYNNATGALFFDSDGVGGAAQTLFAVATNTPALTNFDFFVV